MVEDTLILDAGDEAPNQFTLENEMNDMENAADGDDKEEVMEEDFEPPQDQDDDEDFRLEGYDDLGLNQEEDDDEYQEEDAQGYDAEYDDNVVGQKRKRVKPAEVGKVARSSQRHVIRSKPDDGVAFILDEDAGFISRPSSRVPGTFGRRGHIKGDSLPAYHKRVSHELDSDDELMMEMREKGFSDRQIADKLARDGRVRYDQKSISTRIMRIRLAQADNVDFLLKEGYKEWEFEDDCLLMQAHALADIEINYEVERVRAWRFRKVSEYMRRLNKDALFSANACRERYNVLQDGTALIPTEADDDPDTRRAELETYRETREQARNKEQAVKDLKDTTDRKQKNESKTKNAEKAVEIANKRAQKENEKAQRAMSRAAAAQVRAQRANEHATARAQRNKQLKGQKNVPESKFKTRTSVVKKKVTFESNPNDTLTQINTRFITADTPDPRSALSLPDLGKMCADRGLGISGKLKEELIKELQDADSEWSVNDLKKMCRVKGLNANGSKFQMRYLLALAAAQLLPSFGDGIEDEDLEK